MSIFNELNYRYNLYFSHSWNENNAVEDLNSLLRLKPDFDYMPQFFSRFHPVNHTHDERKLYEAIKSKMKFCDALILLCGVYSTYSRWINKELIACRDELNKPIIAVQRYEPRRTSFVVKENADIIVEWDANAIVGAIRTYVRTPK